MFINSNKSKVGTVSTRNTLRNIRNIEQYIANQIKGFIGICVYESVIAQLYRQVSISVLFSNRCCHNINKEALPGVLGNKGIYFRVTGEQRLNFEGNRGTKTILGNREH